VVTGGSGTTAGKVLARYDYQAFGDYIPVAAGSGRRGIPEYVATDDTNQHFTSKERDIESGLDYFGARYYSSQQGRFTSVDPVNRGASRNDPQSWNAYPYVINNPLALVDPKGQDWYWRAGVWYWFNETDEKEGYVHLVGTVLITNEKGATGRFSRYNGQNILLTNDSSVPIDLGVYRPPDPQEKATRDWAAAMLWQFTVVSITGGLLLAESPGLLAAVLLARPLLKEQGEAIELSLKADRDYGVNQAWKQERELVKAGGGTLDWTPEEREELIRTGRVKGVGIEGHHINNVADHAEMARDPNNVKFVRGKAAHLAEHGGNFGFSEGPLIDRTPPVPKP
jgi:RHS repeat-associated protein